MALEAGAAFEVESAAVQSRHAWLGAAVAGLLALLVYVNSLPNALVYDDLDSIVRNSAVRDPTDWRTILLTSSWKLQGTRTPISYRPLSTWTFALDYAMHGTRPFGYHLVNVLGHCLVSGLVVLLAVAFGLSPLPATLAGILFAMHPVHTEVVANGVGRAEILSAALALAALISARRAAGCWPFVRSATTVTLYGLALLAKEHTIGLLAVIPFADFMLVDGGSPRAFLRGLVGRRGVFYLALAAMTAAYLTLRAFALGSVIGAGSSGLRSIEFWANPAASVPTASRILTGLEVLARAGGLLVWPYVLSADYSYRQIPVVTALGDPRAWAGLAVVGIAVLAAVILFKRQPLACVWLALTGTTYAVVSNIPFPIGTIFGERLLYLPSVGACALAAMVLAGSTSRMPRRIIAAALVTVIGTWCLTTIHRNRAWHDDLALGESMVVSAPESVHAHHFLGAVYFEMGRDEEALIEFQRALTILPGHVSSLYDVAVIREHRRESEAAAALYRQVVEMDPSFFPAWINLSSLEQAQGRLSSALEAADGAVAAAPNAPATHMVRANVLHRLGHEEEARSEYVSGLRALARAALDLRDYTLAIDSLRRLIDVAPSPDAYRDLVDSLTREGSTAEAERVRATARARYPTEVAFKGGREN